MSRNLDGTRANIRCVREFDLESRVFLNSKITSKPRSDREALKYDFIIDYNYNTASFSEQINKRLKINSHNTNKFNCFLQDTCCSKHSLIEQGEVENNKQAIISKKTYIQKISRAHTISNSSFMNESSFYRVSSKYIL
jgi:hypothetical protein